VVHECCGKLSQVDKSTSTLSTPERSFRSYFPNGDDALRATLAQQGIGMTKPLAFSNTYALGMLEAVAGTFKGSEHRPFARLSRSQVRV
jgi:hypothetical protein